MEPVSFLFRQNSHLNKLLIRNQATIVLVREFGYVIAGSITFYRVPVIRFEWGLWVFHHSVFRHIFPYF